MAALASTGDLDDLNEVCSPEVAHEWRTNMESFAFSDRTFTVDELVADASRVAVLWTNTGTHTAPYAGIPASGKKTTGHGSAFFSLSGGTITKVTTYFDAEGLFRELGATIQPPG
ncbi:MAG: hypothetical protein JWP61_1180 [Friedmanniella sp.]|nr:hypothetical protein [Friedmanniella sp.]